jgi:DNA-binding CsgD family transcriptional regulator
VLSACRETFDIRRAHEWTSAFSQWCTAQPDLVPFRGYCLIRRAEILQLHGDWDEALDEVRKAAKRMDDPASKAELGAATYQEAEIHRLRGEFREAEERYREANQLGHQPQPGLAQLRLAQGQADTALAAIAGALESASARRNRPPLLFPAVEIMLAAEDHSSADRAAEELASIAEELGGPMLRAMSAHATGATRLAGGDAHQALASLRDAGSLWQELRAPYELARVRVLLAIACRELGDTDSAELELDAARQCFGELGAAPELERLEKLAGASQVERGGKLTARELEVLRRLAKGETNRAIAARLAISEKTVARHVSNIFTKLDLSSRAAATAYAYQHNLVGG